MQAWADVVTRGRDVPEPGRATLQEETEDEVALQRGTAPGRTSARTPLRRAERAHKPPAHL